jgi:hypothetical protein
VRGAIEFTRSGDDFEVNVNLLALTRLHRPFDETPLAHP